MAVPGSVVAVMPGTYSETFNATTTGLPSGTAGNPIVLSCAPVSAGGGLGTVTVQMSQASIDTPGTRPCWAEMRSFFWLNGLVLKGVKGRTNAPLPGPSSFAGWDAIHHLNSGGTNVTDTKVTNCVIYSQAESGGTFDPFITVEGNVFFGNGYAFQDHAVYAHGDSVVTNGNIVLSSAGAGIHYYSGANSVNNAVITLNLSVGNGFAGILLGGIPASGGTVEHNTAAYNGLYGMDYFNGCTVCTCDHNLFAFNGAYQTGFGGTANLATCIDDFNGLFAVAPAAISVTGGATPGPTLGANEIIADPGFVAIGTGNFHAGNVAMAGRGCYP